MVDPESPQGTGVGSLRHGYRPRVLDGMASTAWRRPWALLTANLVVLAASLAIAITGAGGLPIGPLAPSGTASGEPDLIVATTGDVSAHSPIYRVALRVISSQVEADSAVAHVQQGPVSADGRSTSLLVSFSGIDDSERQDAVERIEAVK